MPNRQVLTKNRKETLDGMSGDEDERATRRS